MPDSKSCQGDYSKIEDKLHSNDQLVGYYILSTSNVTHIAKNNPTAVDIQR